MHRLKPRSAPSRPPKKVAVVHWAHAERALPVIVRLYEQLFAAARPEESGDFLEALTPDSRTELSPGPGMMHDPVKHGIQCYLCPKSTSRFFSSARCHVRARDPGAVGATPGGRISS